MRRLGRDALRGIGVRFGGPLDRKAGVIQAPPNLSTRVDVPSTSMLRNEIEVDCRIENDANASAVAEHHFGAGQGCRDAVFLTMGKQAWAPASPTAGTTAARATSPARSATRRSTRSGPFG